jgi:hypothetical protein
MPQEVVTVGVDLANNVFQVHSIDIDGKVLIRRQLRWTHRSPAKWISLIYRNERDVGHAHCASGWRT